MKLWKGRITGDSDRLAESFTASINIDRDLYLYDITGKLVSGVNNIKSTTIIINRGNLGNGLYFYSLTDNGNILSSGKFMITD